MDNNRIFKILGMIALFVLCAVLGYFITPGGKTDSVSQEKVEIDPIKPQTDRSQQRSKPSTRPVISSYTVGKRLDKNGRVLDYTLKVKASVESGDVLEYLLFEYNATEAKYDAIENGFPCVSPIEGGKYTLVVRNVRTNEEATTTVVGFDKPEEDASTQPVIVSYNVSQRGSANYKKLGFTLTVSASVESGDALEYLLFVPNGSEPKYRSQSSTIRDVLPIDGGKYTLVVRNTRAGAEATKEIRGFDKISRWSATELQRELNAINPTKLFYHHFDNDRVRFDVVGEIDGSVPKTLNGLMSDRAANGWDIKVVGMPQYDEFNRIVYFKISLY